jgi:hypothetical protein
MEIFVGRPGSGSCPEDHVTGRDEAVTAWPKSGSSRKTTEADTPQPGDETSVGDASGSGQKPDSAIPGLGGRIPIVAVCHDRDGIDRVTIDAVIPAEVLTNIPPFRPPLPRR